MTKRETFLVILMVVAVGMGAYTLFFDSSEPSGSSKENQSAVQNFEQTVSTIRQGLEKHDLSRVEEYALKRAQASWQRDPFYDRYAGGELETAGGVSETKKIEFSYTGYIQMDTRRLAIINGREYQAGERLEAEGYAVQSIHPDRVTLVRTGSQEEGGRLTVPMEENISFPSLQ
ncbi:MAG: hypothetical protein ACLFTB_00655 [Desulfovibrionales bacterium]